MDNLKCQYCGSPALIFSHIDEYDTLDDEWPRPLYIYTCLNCGKNSGFETEEVNPEQEPGDDEWA